MDSCDIKIVLALSAILVATGIACLNYGPNGILVALICLCAINIDEVIEGGLVALFLVALLLAWMGLNPVVWLGGASVAICVAVIVIVIVDRLWYDC